MKDFVVSIVVALVLTAISYLVARELGWIHAIDWLEAGAVATSYSCTYLCVKQRRSNYPIGAISTALYAILFIKAGLYASAALNIYLAPALIYGWLRWGPDEATRAVGRVSLAWLPVYVGVTAVTYGLVLAVVIAIGGTLPAADSAILIGSILAQYLLDNKKIENWAVWAAVNVLAIIVYAPTLPLVGLQYVFFLGNTLYGAVCWWRSMHRDRFGAVTS